MWITLVLSSLLAAATLASPIEVAQEEGDLINYDIDPELAVSDSELLSISSQIWSRDENRFSSRDYRLSTGGPRLFSYVNEGKLGGATYNRFIPLLNNFIPNYGIAEPPCAQCRSAEDLWLNNVISTRPMQTTWDFLVSKGLASSDFSTFKRLLKQLWFKFYSRSRGPIDSCGFEHVFVGETDRGSVKGFHNWVQSYLEEKNGDWNFQTVRKTCSSNLLAVRFNWIGNVKSYGSMFIGPSPEAELSLYTLCFLTRNGNCQTNLGGNSVTITTYPMNNVSPRTISTAFPAC